jgi:hypothetical protein
MPERPALRREGRARTWPARPRSAAVDARRPARCASRRGGPARGDSAARVRGGRPSPRRLCRCRLCVALAFAIESAALGRGGPKG